MKFSLLVVVLVGIAGGVLGYWCGRLDESLRRTNEELKSQTETIKNLRLR